MEGAGGCALSLLILCLQDMKTPPKSQSLSTWDLHGGDPSSKQTLRSIMSQIRSTCRDSSEEPTSVSLHPHQGSALWLHPPTPLCCSAPAELEASSELSPALPPRAGGRQEQHTRALVPAPAAPTELRARHLPRKLFVFLGEC